MDEKYEEKKNHWTWSFRLHIARETLGVNPFVRRLWMSIKKRTINIEELHHLFGRDTSFIHRSAEMTKLKSIDGCEFFFVCCASIIHSGRHSDFINSRSLVIWLTLEVHLVEQFTGREKNLTPRIPTARAEVVEHFAEELPHSHIKRLLIYYILCVLNFRLA